MYINPDVYKLMQKASVIQRYLHKSRCIQINVESICYRTIFTLIHMYLIKCINDQLGQR